MKPIYLTIVIVLLTISSTACSALATPTPSQLEILQTALAQAQAMSTANPNGHLHEIMAKNGVTLTAREVQYNMSNNVGKEFGLSGMGELCDYYNWGYDKSIEPNYFCIEVTPSGGYLEKWYIYFDRSNNATLYQDMLHGKVQIFLIAEISRNLYEKNQEPMATGLYAEWIRY